MITTHEATTTMNLAAEMDHLAARLNVRSLAEALYFPKYFQVETVRVCNARCPFCAIDQWDKSVPLMSDHLFKKIVDEIGHYSHWVEAVCVQRAGEPLLDKKIVERVAAFKYAGIKRVNMSTNASLLNEIKARELLEAGLDEIMLSIDSVDRESYEAMRVQLDYDTVITNINTFFRVRDEIKPDAIIRIRGVFYHDLSRPEHREELARWEQFWASYRKPHDRIYMKRAHSWGNQKIWEGHTPVYDDVYHPCIIPWSTMHITAMGTVALCPHDYDAKIELGDVNTHSIADVWRSGNLNRIRALHAGGNRNDITLCRGCRLFDLEFSLEDWQQKQLWES